MVFKCSNTSVAITESNELDLNDEKCASIIISTLSC